MPIYEQIENNVNSVRHAGTVAHTRMLRLCANTFFNRFIHDTDNETHNNFDFACTHRCAARIKWLFHD